MKKCFIMVGPAGSGKTTWVEKNKTDLDFVVSLDAYRMQFYDKMHPNDKNTDYDIAWEYSCVWTDDFNYYVEQESELAFSAAATLDVNIFVDNTNLTAKSRKKWVETAKKLGFTVVAVEFTNTLNAVILQNENRKDKKIPTSVVKDQFYRQECPIMVKEVDDVITVRSYQPTKDTQK